MVATPSPASPFPDRVPTVRIGVLASGSGTILEAILAAGLPVALVMADRPCRALGVASESGLDARLLDRALFGGFDRGFDRLAYTEALVDVLVHHRIDVVVMAGFGTVLDEPIHAVFPGRVLNTHPALLPEFPGWHAVDRALAAGVSETGCTVHVATLDMDAGPILAQRTVPVLPDDTVATLHERIKAVERTLYPDTIRAFIDKLVAPVGQVCGANSEVSS